MGIRLIEELCQGAWTIQPILIHIHRVALRIRVSKYNNKPSFRRAWRWFPTLTKTSEHQQKLSVHVHVGSVVLDVFFDNYQ